MCGICGVWLKDNKPAEQTWLQQFNNTMVHRGPDDEGYHIDGAVALAMRRFALSTFPPVSNPLATKTAQSGSSLMVRFTISSSFEVI